MATADHLMIDRRILQEAKSLIAAGHQVTLLAGFECPARESYVLDGIRIERFVYDWADTRFAKLAASLRLRPGSKLYSWAWRIFRFSAARVPYVLSSFENFIFERMLEYQVDVLHVHDFPMLAPGLRLAKVRRVPLIYDAHELYYAQVQLSARVQRAYRVKEARLIRRASQVITVNPYIAKLMAERYEIKLPHVILNASPLVEKENSQPLRQRFGLSDRHKILLYQGWISSNRGIERLVEAAEYFDEHVVLVVIGYGDYERTLKDLVASKRLENKVFFYGGVPSEQLHALTCDADLGVIPYHGVDENNYYCSPNKLFEFAIAGLPFICNDLPYLRDVVQRYGNGRIADLGSPKMIATTVNSVMSDEGLLEEIRAGAMRARLELNWDVESKKLLDIYASIGS